MTITAIKQQVKLTGRYSIFVDGKYSFSLSDTALLDSKLINGQEITQQELNKFKELSNEDKIYSQVLRYVYTRQRTAWEIESYLKRKKIDDTLSQVVISKLNNLDLIDDEKFARSFVADRQLLKPTSRRKLSLELKQKRVKDEIIQAVIADQPQEQEGLALETLVATKRRQNRYQDDEKLMQYLARQGFGYQDIKNALHSNEF